MGRIDGSKVLKGDFEGEMRVGEQPWWVHPDDETERPPR